MKLPYIVALFAFIGAANIALAQSASIELEWDKNPEPDITSYNIYTKTTTAAVPPATEPTITWRRIGTVDAATVKFAIAKVPTGTTVYAVTAVNAAKIESEKSNEVSNTYIVPPKLKISKLTFTGTP